MERIWKSMYTHVHKHIYILSESPCCTAETNTQHYKSTLLKIKRDYLCTSWAWQSLLRPKFPSKLGITPHTAHGLRLHSWPMTVHQSPQCRMESVMGAPTSLLPVHSCLGATGKESRLNLSWPLQLDTPCRAWSWWVPLSWDVQWHTPSPASQSTVPVPLAY